MDDQRRLDSQCCREPLVGGLLLLGERCPPLAAVNMRDRINHISECRTAELVPARACSLNFSSFFFPKIACLTQFVGIQKKAFLINDPGDSAQLSSRCSIDHSSIDSIVYK